MKKATILLLVLLLAIGLCACGNSTPAAPAASETTAAVETAAPTVADVPAGADNGEVLITVDNEYFTLEILGTSFATNSKGDTIVHVDYRMTNHSDVVFYDEFLDDNDNTYTAPVLEPGEVVTDYRTWNVAKRGYEWALYFAAFSETLNPYASEEILFSVDSETAALLNWEIVASLVYGESDAPLEYTYDNIDLIRTDNYALSLTGIYYYPDQQATEVHLKVESFCEIPVSDTRTESDTVQIWRNSEIGDNAEELYFVVDAWSGSNYGAAKDTPITLEMNTYFQLWNEAHDGAYYTRNIFGKEVPNNLGKVRLTLQLSQSNPVSGIEILSAPPKLDLDEEQTKAGLNLLIFNHKDTTLTLTYLEHRGASYIAHYVFVNNSDETYELVDWRDQFGGNITFAPGTETEFTVDLGSRTEGEIFMGIINKNKYESYGKNLGQETTWDTFKDAEETYYQYEVLATVDGTIDYLGEDPLQYLRIDLK